MIWTDAPLIQDAFAYEMTVANEMRGIGVPVFDAAQDFGSAGRLRSMAVMDWIGKYPEDPRQQFLGENSTLSVLGQEVGHRWLAFFEFRDHTGKRRPLLGRGDAHWSFFFDSDASVMEGNDIEDLGGGSFRTVGAVSRYSLLDQYAMGLVAPGQVPPFFYVQNPDQPVRRRARASRRPQIGVTFNGTRRDVLIQDIIAIHGPRVPSAAESAQGPPPGVHLSCRAPAPRRRRPPSQARSHPPPVGGVLPERHRRPDDGDDSAAVMRVEIRHGAGRPHSRQMPLRLSRSARRGVR